MPDDINFDSLPDAPKPLVNQLDAGDDGFGGPIDNERLPPIKMPAPVKAEETPAIKARTAAAKAGVHLRSIPEEERLGHVTADFDSLPDAPSDGSVHAAWMAHASTQTPEEAARAADLAPKVGLAPGYVGDNLQDVKRQTDQQTMTSNMARAPGLAAFAQDPNRAPAIRDDTTTLADIENAITGKFQLPDPQQIAFSGGQKGWGDYTSPLWLRSLRDAMREQRANVLETAHALLFKSHEGFSNKGNAELAGLEAPATDAQAEDNSIIGKAIGGAAGMAPYMAGAILAGGVGGAVGGKPGEVASLGAFNLWETFGPAVKSLREARNPDGSFMYSDTEIPALAAISAAAQTAAMTGVQEVTGHVFGAPMVGKEVNTSIMNWLNLGGANTIKGFTARYGFHATIGAATVAAQHSIHAAVEEAGKYMNDQAHDFSRPFSEFGPAFIEGMESMLLPAAIGPVMEARNPMPVKPPPDTLAIIGLRVVMEQEQAKLDSMISNIEKAKIAKHSPTQTQQAISLATDQPGAATTAFVTKEAFDKVHGDDAPAVSAQRGGNYEEAHLMDNTIAFPLEAHLAHAGHSGEARELLPDTKLAADSKTPNELGEHQPTLDELLGLAGKPIPLTEDDLAPPEPLATPKVEPTPTVDTPAIAKERLATRAQVDKEVSNDPAGHALDVLRDDSGALQKLDRGYVTEHMGPAIAARLDKLGVLKANQMHPNDLANQLGFNNAHEMAHAILELPGEDERNKEVQRRLEEKHPELLSPDMAKTRADAIEAAHTPQELERVLREINQLGKPDHAPAKALAEAGKRLARPDLFPPAHYEGLEREAEARARAAETNGDTAAAKAARDAKDVATASKLEAQKFEKEQAAQEAERTETDAAAHFRLMQGTVEKPGELEMYDVQHEAERLVNQKALGDIDPAYYLAGERSAADKAAKAAVKGDIQGVIDAKKAQLLNMFGWRAARDIHAELTATKSRLDKSYSPDSRAEVAKAGPVYLNALDIAMEGIGTKRTFSPTEWWSPQGGERLRTDAMNAVFQQMITDGLPPVPVVEDALQKLITRQNGELNTWDKLTPQQARNTAGAIKAIQNAAKAAVDLGKVAENVSFNKVIQEIAIDTNGKMSIEPQKYTSGNPKPDMVRARETLNGLNAFLLRFKENVRDLGPMATRILFDAMIAARTYKEDLAARIAPFFEKNWREVPADIQSRAYEKTDLRAFFPLPGDRFNELAQVPRTWLYALRLHDGSSGNIDRFLAGPTTIRDEAATVAARSANPYAEPVMHKPWSKAMVDHVLYENPVTRLTKPEMDFLQTVHDHETKGDGSGQPPLWDLIKKSQEDRFGIAPPKVAGVPRTVPFPDGTTKTYEGGYHHLAEDRSTAQTGGAAIENIADAFGKKYQFATTSDGYAEERAASAKYMTDMTWESIPNHLSQVIHDLAFGDWVRAASRLTLNKEFKDNADRVLGSARADAIQRQVKVIATGQSDSVIQGHETFWKGVRWSKDSAVVGIVGYSIPMAIGQLSHIPGMFVGGKVSLVHGIPALISLMKPFGFDAESGLHLFPNIEAAQQLSSELRHREANATAIMGDVRNVFGSQRQGFAKALIPVDIAKQHAGIFLHHVDTYLSAWAFTASRAEGIAKNMTDTEAEHYANGVVQDIMPDHSIETMAPLLADKKLGAATLIMHGFGNTLYQMAYRDVVRPFTEAMSAGDVAGMAKSVGRGIQHGAMLATLGMVGKLLWGHGPEQGESWGAWVIRNALAAPGLIVPYMGGAAEWAANKTVQALPDWWTKDSQGHGAAKSVGYSEMQAPGFAVAQKLHELVTHLGSTKEDATQKAAASMSTIMALLHVAPLPLERQGSYLAQVASGKVRPRGPGDVVSGLTGYSTSKKADRNIPTVLQDQFSLPGTHQ